MTTRMRWRSDSPVERVVQSIEKGEPVCKEDLDYCNHKFAFLPIKGYKKEDDDNFDDGLIWFEGNESNFWKLTDKQESFLFKYYKKNKVWKKEYEEMSCEQDFDYDDHVLAFLSEDEKEIQKQEEFEAKFNNINLPDGASSSSKNPKWSQPVFDYIPKHVWT